MAALGSVALALFQPACATRAPAGTGSPGTDSARPALVRAESAYAELRALRDRYEVTTAAGRSASPEGTPLAEMARRHDEARRALVARLAGVDSAALAGDDRRALGVMRRALGAELAALGEGPGPAEGAAERRGEPACAYDSVTLMAAARADSLRRWAYACYGWAQHHVVVGADTVDRLTMLARLARTDDRARRRELFLALAPVWRTMNGDGGAGSPYRLLARLDELRRGRPGGAGDAGQPPVATVAGALGVEPAAVERWLLAILGAWRAASGDSVLEPWDWHYAAGRAARALDARVPADRLVPIAAAVYRALGADVDSVGVRYDLAPREGKTPVAFTTFGARARASAGAPGGWTRAEPWVFATYRAGGLDNLNELLHETGHAVHIAAIRTRPAFADWPDSDPLTEALAEWIALDVYEPAWQRRWLGDSVPLADGLRARYAGIVLDVAWALFEVRMGRDPGADPNRVWAAITNEYLRIRPHPELAWWAMRGQLVDAPGYMMNYAVGAVLVADLRARARALHGDWTSGDSTWYAWVAPRLYRPGLERPSREVLPAFLGRAPTADAILADMRRMRRR